MGELKFWLLERGYSGNEVDSQIDRVRDKNRATLLDARPKEKDDMKITFSANLSPSHAQSL